MLSEKQLVTDFFPSSVVVMNKQPCVDWCACRSPSSVLLINPLQECNTAITALKSAGRVKSSETFSFIFYELRARGDVYTEIRLLPDSERKGHDTDTFK